MIPVLVLQRGAHGVTWPCGSPGASGQEAERGGEILGGRPPVQPAVAAVFKCSMLITTQ
jgi:hypothetical protein